MKQHFSQPLSSYMPTLVGQPPQEPRQSPIFLPPPVPGSFSITACISPVPPLKQYKDTNSLCLEMEHKFPPPSHPFGSLTPTKIVHVPRNDYSDMPKHLQPGQQYATLALIKPCHYMKVPQARRRVKHLVQRMLQVSEAEVTTHQSPTTEITLQWKAKLTPLLLEIRKVFKGLFSTQEGRISSLTFQVLHFYFYNFFKFYVKTVYIVNLKERWLI